MTPRPSEQAPEILGGNTPFISAADGVRVFEHLPMNIKIDGKEMTREVFWTLCAMMTVMVRRGEVDHSPLTADEFLRQYIASANHDLRLTGRKMLSLDEVNEMAASPAIVAAIESAARREQK